MSKIKVGQLYSFHKDPNEPNITLDEADRKDRMRLCGIVFQVTTVDGFIGVTPLKDRTGWFEIGQEYIAKERDVLNSGNYRLIWDPDSKTDTSSEIDHGINCSKCNKYFPDAAKINDFKCWACRNGF